MGLGDKIKTLFNVSEEEYYDDMDIEENEAAEEESAKDVRSSSFGFGRSRSESDSNVYDMRTSAPASHGGSKTNIKVYKIDRFDDVATVAQQINDKKIVVLNLETCPSDVSVRIIDFISGVSFANSAEIKRIAGKVYIISPYNVPLTGEMLDGIEHTTY